MMNDEFFIIIIILKLYLQIGALKKQTARDYLVHPRMSG